MSDNEVLHGMYPLGPLGAPNGAVCDGAVGDTTMICGGETVTIKDQPTYGWAWGLAGLVLGVAGLIGAQAYGYVPAMRKRNPTPSGGDWVWISSRGKKWEAFLPDKQIVKDRPEYVLYPMHGYSQSLAVEGVNARLIGWMSIETLGFLDVKAWMKFVGYIV